MADTDNTTANNDDFEKVQGFIKEQVQTYFNELQQQQPKLPATIDQQEQAKQQMRDLITPFVQPDIDAAKLVAADAMDQVKFYRNNPDDAAEYGEEVERLFEETKKTGRPMPRQDILDYVVGKEKRTAPDKFAERQTARQKAQLEKASYAGDFGASSMQKAKEDSTFANFESKSLEEMEKLLDGVTF